MRGALFPVTILLALAATAGLALVAFRDPPEASPAASDGAGDPELVKERRPDARTPVLRPYQTTATLAEDLRDALAGDLSKLEAEVWRVSKAFTTQAGWTLLHLARDESSPRVRALLVISAGVHKPDDDLLLTFLDDRAPIVRRAAALATGYKDAGATKAKRTKLMDGFELTLGRSPSERTRTRLRRRLEKEKDDGVRDDLEAVLNR